MNKPTKSTTVAAAAVALALGVGAYADRELRGSNAAVSTASSRYGVLQAQATATPHKRIVPFLGPFAHNKKGYKECGPAVRLMEGALRNTVPPVRKAPASNCMGVAATNQVKKFQARHKIPATGIYGLRTHKALSPRYTQEQRAGLVYIAHLKLVRLERSTVLIITGHAQLVGQGMHYSQSDRSRFPAWPAVPSSTDCSGFVTWVLWQTGVGYRVGYYGAGSAVGWTGTLSKQGKLVGIHGPLAVGDLIFYGGGYPYGHVEIYVGHGRTVGHGSPGVHNHPYNYRPVMLVRRYIY